MSKLLDAFEKNPLTLIVSLPENSADLARAALRGGADALKIHINIKHAAAGTEFGTFKEEKSIIEDILEASDIPVGIVPGEEKLPSKEEMKELIAMGIDFFDVKLKYLPQWMLDLKGIGKIAALDEKYLIDEILEFGKLGIDALEVAIIPKSQYGKELTAGDLQQYITLSGAAGVPIIIPTQKRIAVSEVPIIWDTGAKAIMIGAIVTGKTAGSIEKVTRDFRIAVDDLG
ncbi:hypothetical protein AMJ44_03890 [candidate division WOR-1 bacterium DG_54_3]|uniref:Orotidine 5'-phosphate decarboxylase domain-containing protein n=1 Tax=candidate division WOR-1 bacterium DG_54_3 TaxID=1703775 RepID=A0A0S7Y4T3_UNCSA|nr:MAG: hypothetical protein AMJ44_03890 [candidate division WOR-1 bacterium DG_54_3]